MAHSNPEAGQRAGNCLSRRALNRATLARQLLLTRAELPVPAAVHQLGGLHAQEPNTPYLSLWTRLAGFRKQDLTQQLADRTVVRATAFRGTQHMVTGTDYRWLRPVLQPLLTRIQRNVFGKRTKGVDPAELLAAGRALLAGRTLTRPELGRLLQQRWPNLDRTALGWSVQYLEPILHPAPNGTWNIRGRTLFELATDVLGPVDSFPAPEILVRYYLAAFGPASVADLRAWSGVSGLREVVTNMGSELLTFTDDAGRKLYDLPDAPRPDPEVPVPVRFLPEFDNLMLAYTNRTRVIIEEDRRMICLADYIAPTVLLDGKVCATWSINPQPTTTLLTVQPFRQLTKADHAAITDEGARLLEFAAPDAETCDLRIAPPP
ncbi:winged helix DNA-binding domain-containing protein [Arthrobacter pigmenti]